jgi:N-acetyl-anhydromuramyl-L-alanine amidase AmpD
LEGRPIFSGHERDDKQVFWPYHWLIRNDGHAERLLSDSEIGWHAGNWDINCRSIAIALDNAYEKGRPSDLVLWAVAALIVNRYEQVPITRVLGHREVNERTTCPSELFLSGPAGKGWKNDLNRTLAQYRDDPANRT